MQLNTLIIFHPPDLSINATLTNHPASSALKNSAGLYEVSWDVAGLY